MGGDEAEETRREVEEELGVADTNRLIMAIISRLDLVSFVDFKRTRRRFLGFDRERAQMPICSNHHHCKVLLLLLKKIRPIRATKKREVDIRET